MTSVTDQVCVTVSNDCLSLIFVSKHINNTLFCLHVIIRYILVSYLGTQRFNNGDYFEGNHAIHKLYTRYT